MILSEVKKIKELTDVEAVNEFLDCGWKLLRIFNINGRNVYVVAKTSSN